MISCNKATKLMTVREDRSLTQSERFHLQLHLGVCSLCRKYLQQTSLIVRSIKQLSASGEVALKKAKTTPIPKPHKSDLTRFENIPSPELQKNDLSKTENMWSSKSQKSDLPGSEDITLTEQKKNEFRKMLNNQE